MRTAVDEAVATVRQAQDILLIQLQTYLRSRSREAAARLDAAIDDERDALEAVAGDRHQYLAAKFGEAR